MGILRAEEGTLVCGFRRKEQKQWWREAVAMAVVAGSSSQIGTPTATYLLLRLWDLPTPVYLHKPADCPREV